MKKIIGLTIIPFFILFILYKTQRENLNLSFNRKYSNSLVYKNSFKIKGSNLTRVRKNGDFFALYDLATNKIITINKTTLKEKMYGGFGEASGKFKLVIGMDMDSSNLYLLDPRNKRQTIINYFTNEIECHKINSFERGVTLTSKCKVLNVFNNKKNDIDFIKSNFKNNNFDTLISPLKIIGDGAFANDGFYKKNSNNDIIFTLYHIGKFICLDSCGKVKYTSSTIDNYSKLPITVKTGGSFVISKKSVSANITSALNSKYIYILSNLKSSLDNLKFPVDTKFIDVYSLKDGKYVYSFPLNDINTPINDIEVDDSSLYILTSNQIVTFNLF